MMRRVSAGVAARVGRGGLGVEETSQRVDVSISHLGGVRGGGVLCCSAYKTHAGVWVRVARQNEARARRALLSSFDMCAHVCNVRLCLVLCSG